MEESELPQSKTGSEEPIFASPLLKAGAEIAPHRGARAIDPPFHISRVNNNLSYQKGGCNCWLLNFQGKLVDFCHGKCYDVATPVTKREE